MEVKNYTAEELVTRWEDRRDIKNLMGKYVVSFLIKKEPEIFASFWSARGDVCYGVNEGWYSGRDAIRGYYDSLDAKTIAVRDKLIELFPEKAGGKTPEELYGIGLFEPRSITNSVIEIAADGETAKGMWHCFGYVTDIDTHGPVSNWIFATLCADFIREDGEWRIWHLMYLEDINNPSGTDWSGGEYPYPEFPEFESLRSVKPAAPNVPCVLRERYSVRRPYIAMPRLPEPYAAFGDTFSYGM